MNDTQRWRKALKRIHARNDGENYIDGLLGRHNADGSNTFVPQGLPRHKLVRIRSDQPPVPARDDVGVPESLNLPVRLRIINSIANTGVVQYAIERILHDDSLATTPPPDGSGIPPHLHDLRYFTEDEHINVSAGAADAAKPAVLDAGGKWDASFIDSEDIADIVGTMVTGNTETGIAVTYQDADNTIDFVVDDEYIQDLIGAMVSGNTETNISVTYDDTGAKLNFVVATEDIQDIVGAMVSGGTETNISVTYDDTNGRLDFVVSTSTEEVQDIVGAMVAGNTETGIAVTYDDSDGTLDFVVDTEFISDTVGAMVTGNTETDIAVTYDDADNTLDFVVSPTLVADRISAAATDDTIADADLWGYITGGVLVKTAWSNINATLKIYFDTLYGLLATANTWVQNQTIATTQTTGNALRVIRNLTSTSTDAPVVDIVQDHASDDQIALRVQQDGTGNVLSLFDGATEVVTVEDGGNVGINNATPAYKVDIATTTDDGIYITGSGVGGPIIVLDATNATVSSRFTGLIYASGGVRQWSQQLRFGDGHFHWFDIVNVVTRMLLTNTGDLGIGLTTGASILARLHILQSTLGGVVQRLQSTATNDDPIQDILQGRIATTDATVTTLFTMAIPASHACVLEATVIGRRTAGSAGAVEDCAAYLIRGLFNQVAGAAAIVAQSQTIIGESQAAWEAVFDVNSTNARIRVTGAVNNTITWHAHVYHRYLST